MLGLRIAALRRTKGWSQAELARRLKISPSAVGMYEQGRREPSLDMLVALAELFDVSADYLLTGRLEAPRDTAAAEAAFRRCMEALLEKTDRHSGFSRQELAVLMAAVLTEG